MPAATQMYTKATVGTALLRGASECNAQRCPETSRRRTDTHRYSWVCTGMHMYAQGVHGSALVVYGCIWLWILDDICGWLWHALPCCGMSMHVHACPGKPWQGTIGHCRASGLHSAWPNPAAAYGWGWLRDVGDAWGCTYKHLQLQAAMRGKAWQSFGWNLHEPS